MHQPDRDTESDMDDYVFEELTCSGSATVRYSSGVRISEELRHRRSLVRGSRLRSVAGSSRRVLTAPARPDSGCLTTPSNTRTLPLISPRSLLMLTLRRCVVGVVAVLLMCTVAGCGGGDSSSPTAPTPTPAPTSVTLSGTVTNIVTGVPVGDATVTIGSASATSSADGTYSLAVTAAGQASFSVSASSYYT
jgi:hypothetical protein